ncbi:MAG: alpha/beta hydrolase [Candidatus Eremiobacteraeota bacterium]|nr:alpha/beta hydrolase [Candidatus Eremiobacteraeota bacterium]MBV8366522.1 alpha/beta hydrolase [Candidatus Eremiobacteraeota bacterium]
MSAAKPARTIALIHGLFLNHQSWDPWVERYKQRGFDVRPLAWPGLEGSVEELRNDPTPLTKLSVKSVLDNLSAQVSKLKSPIIMGHSFGGLFAQLLAYHGFGSAVVGIDPTAPAGVLELPFSTLRAAAPVLANPLNVDKATMLTPEQFHYAFTNTVSTEKSRELYERYAIPCANRVLFEGAFENFAVHSPARVDVKADRAPILIIAGGQDHLVPFSYSKANFELISKSPGVTALKVFGERPHFTGGVDGWEEVADFAIDWALDPSATTPVPVA